MKLSLCFSILVGFWLSCFQVVNASVIDENGKFVPDVILLEEDTSFHILNYNSPGATGALPFSVHVINQLHQKGLFENDDINLQCGPWKFNEIVEKLEK